MGRHLSLADARDGEDRPPRPPAAALDVASTLAARCTVRPGETADSGGSGPGLLGRRSVCIQRHGAGVDALQDGD